eukprot:2949581-Amphidinium_carterae.1
MAPTSIAANAQSSDVAEGVLFCKRRKHTCVRSQPQSTCVVSGTAKPFGAQKAGGSKNFGGKNKDGWESSTWQQPGKGGDATWMGQSSWSRGGWSSGKGAQLPQLPQPVYPPKHMPHRPAAAAVPFKAAPA